MSSVSSVSLRLAERATMSSSSGVRTFTNALDTPASGAVTRVRFLWQWVAAVRDLFLRVQGSESFRPPGGVDLWHDELQMGGVAASSVLADDVIKLGRCLADSTGDGSNEPGISNTVNGWHFSSPPEYSVALFEECGPLPASGLLIDVNLREQSGELVSVEAGDCEKLLVSHLSASSADVWLGPARCFSTSLARLFYPTFGLVSEVNA